MKEVLAVVVTYNRKKLLERVLKSLCAQSVPCDIFIFDNHSEDGTGEYLKKQGWLARAEVVYCRAKKNLGGAGGFHYGTVYAGRMGYRAAWLMDDDGFCYRRDTLEKLLLAAQKTGEESYIINSLVVRNQQLELTWPFFGGCIEYGKIKAHAQGNLIRHWCSPFNGTLVSRACMEEIGYPLQKMFIYGDELEYLERARAKGVFVATCMDSLYFHPPKLEKKRWLGIPYIRQELPLWGLYCAIRNQSYVVCRYKDHIRLRLMAKCMKYCFRTMAGEKEDRLRRMLVIFRAAQDGARGDFGMDFSDPGKRGISFWKKS